MTSDAPLLDADARAAFADELRENFCVSAGAGVGKTTAIVRRIASLALRRHEQPGVLGRLVVVTYGKLAAEELRIRTRDLVLEHLHEGAAGRQTLLADLRSAFFGTIHSFCLKLIRDEGRFLGLPETISLLEERDEGPLWERFCESDELLGLALPPALLESVSRHLTFDELLSLARQLGPDESAAAADFDPDAPPPVLDFSAAHDDDGGRSKPTTRAHQQHLRRWEEEFAEGAAFLQLPEYKGGSGTFLAAVDAAVEPYARWLNAAAGSLAARIARAYLDYRLDQGLMTFRDQIHWCQRLVADPVVLNRLRLRSYLIILDEAQDTDAEMFSILTEITRPIGAVPGQWPGTTDAPGPEPGRFSFVGDDQQAIYGERADLAVYRRYLDAYKAGDGGRHLEFSVTMRCPRRVIDATNAVFGNGRLPQEFVHFRALAPRPACPEGAAWRLDLGTAPPADGDGAKPGLDARLTRECEGIADYLSALGLPGLGIASWSEVAVICPRVRWLETAARVFESRGLPGVLLSQRRVAREQARYSWPAALFHVLLHPWDRFELIGVLRELFAVSDVDLARLHRRATVANDGRGLSFWPDAPDPVKGHVPAVRLHRALTLLHELRAKMPGEERLKFQASSFKKEGKAKGKRPEAEVDCATLSRYVDYVLEQTALGARLEAIGEPAAALEPLRARALQAECEGVTLREWVRGLVRALEEPAPTPPGAGNAVQFLTVLKAKGLEWPVVIPLGLGCQVYERTENYPRVERHDGQAIIHFSKATVDPARKALRQKRRDDEFQRMLYVTLTRAKRLLLAPDGSGLYDGRGPNFLALARWQELDLPALFSPPPAPEEAPTVPVRHDPDDHAPKLFRENKRRLKEAAEISQRIPKRVLPSGLVHGEEGPKHKVQGPSKVQGSKSKEEGEGEDLSLALATPDPEPSEDDRLLATEGEAGAELAGIGGIDYGNWWHATLERYPWADPDPAARARYLDEARARLAGSVDWLARAEAELALLAASPAHAEFVGQGEVFLPEMPFSHPGSAQEWMEGIMDLVIVTGAGDLWIVDWKTDRRRAEDADDAAFLSRLAERYGPQLRAYAQVFAQGFGRPVGRLLLYSTVLGATVAVE